MLTDYVTLKKLEHLDPAKIWPKQSANITSLISPTGRTTTLFNAPAPVWKKVYEQALASELAHAGVVSSLWHD
jgi:hypothetical protein